MKENFITYPILDSETCASLLETFEGENWTDGVTNTVGLSEKVKKSLYLDVNSIYYQPASQFIYQGLDSSFEFIHFVQPKQTSPVIFSKTKQGGYYRPHMDIWHNGDFSTTLFLEDPGSYDGGELVFLENGRELKIKLPTGWAITYKTGIPHRVAEVTRGERNVAVFWSLTSVKEDSVREAIRYLTAALKALGSSYPDIAYSDLKEAAKDPAFLIASGLETLRRRFGER